MSLTKIVNKTAKTVALSLLVLPSLGSASPQDCKISQYPNQKYEHYDYYKDKRDTKRKEEDLEFLRNVAVGFFLSVIGATAMSITIEYLAREKKQNQRIGNYNNERGDKDKCTWDDSDYKEAARHIDWNEYHITGKLIKKDSTKI
ncbi:hypothetical protein KW805_02420 [Candidatus Pacearchaeota archaeon]|nr:hypothetical protein [Candidatus Pacearchaeota archaeon]